MSLFQQVLSIMVIAFAVILVADIVGRRFFNTPPLDIRIPIAFVLLLIIDAISDAKAGNWGGAASSVVVSLVWVAWLIGQKCRGTPSVDEEGFHVIKVGSTTVRVRES